jgi:hypothetical protein
MTRAPWLLFPTLALVGCSAATNRATRDRGHGIDNVPTYEAPPKDRCQGMGDGSLKARCDEAKFLAQGYVKKLAVGDEVCLEGGFGEPPAAACMARARVEDVHSERVLLDMKNARPDSRWFGKESHQFWFAEGALVDLYLAEHGY